MKQNYNDHIPVFLDNTIDALRINPDGIYIDCTLGRGGHSQEILKHLSKKGKLIAIDQDQAAIDYCKDKFKNYNNIILIKDNFKNIKNILNKLNINQIDGIIYDLGVSSPQLDDSSRGFSYIKNGPLDMRMDQTNSLSANIIVNTYNLQQLSNIFYEYCDDNKFNKAIANSIIKNRPIKDTLQLSEVIKKALPGYILRKPHHPAKKYFQAIRIAVNDEINSIKQSIKDVIDFIKINGIICVITFHSLEDKTIKNLFHEYIVSKIPKEIPIKESDILFKVIKLKNTYVTSQEILLNNRARSAKIHAIERIKF